ncbi:hypothetical protein B0H15DRAFT_43169 [Mycena belliarum]|uniref:Uncharacterized protein n=1 Tax=Mycena belliarum TaxID=1033014 RepID=A0AAD6TR42_9AGAR|nr:hypothetical protein B0H15DRAFT_43169 [Mycena belliae]
MISLAFVLLSAAFANGAASLVARDSIVCPALNNDNMPLYQESSSTDDRIICTYSGDSEPCSYFTNGGIDGGSDKCPSDISQPDETSISVVLCAAFNENFAVKSTAAQISSSLNVSASLVECTYSDGSECYYNRSDGSANHGTGTCPPSINSTVYSSEYVCFSASLKQSVLIGSSVVASASEAFLACVFEDKTSCSYSWANGSLKPGAGSWCPKQVTKALAYTVSAPWMDYKAQCPPTLSGAPATAGVLSPGDGLSILTCDYTTVRVICEYQVSGGHLADGGSDCQLSLGQVNWPPIGAGAAAPDSAAASSSSSSSASSWSSSSSTVYIFSKYFGSSPWGNTCLAFNEHITASSTSGSQLKASLNISESIVKCTYSDNSDCYYNRKDGSHSTSYSAGQYCPQTIAQYTLSPYVCVSANLKASVLLGSSVAIQTNAALSVVACVFDDQTSCVYGMLQGTLMPGEGSWCPKTAIKSPYYQPAVGAGPAAAGAGKGLLAESGTGNTDNKSSSGTMISKPVLIALLALNGFLVVAVLAIGCFLVFRSPSAGNPRLKPLNAGSGYKTVDSLSAPLTHGDDTYYDPPTKH